MPPTAEAKPEGEEDCKVCKKGKQGSAAFGALLAQRGMAIPGVAAGKQQHPQQTGARALHTTAFATRRSASAHVSNHLRPGRNQAPSREW